MVPCPLGLRPTTRHLCRRSCCHTIYYSYIIMFHPGWIIYVSKTPCILLRWASVCATFCTAYSTRVFHVTVLQPTIPELNNFLGIIPAFLMGVWSVGRVEVSIVQSETGPAPPPVASEMGTTTYSAVSEVDRVSRCCFPEWERVAVAVLQEQCIIPLHKGVAVFFFLLELCFVCDYCIIPLLTVQWNGISACWHHFLYYCIT